MTELSFLIDLLLNHKLPKATLAAVAARIRDVESRVACGPAQAAAFVTRPMLAQPAVIPPHMVGQSASTIAAMMRQEQAGGSIPNGNQANPTVAAPEVTPAPPAPQPVAIVAQTPAAAAAMAERNSAIVAQISGKPEKGRTSPRKF